MTIIISLLFLTGLWLLILYWDVKREKDKRKAKIIDINKLYEPNEDIV